MLKGAILGTLITVFTSTQLLAASPVLPPFSGITQSTTHAVTIDNNSDSSFQFTLSPGGAYDILPNYGYQIPVAPNTQFALTAVNAVQTTSTTTPRVDYAETTEALPYSSAPTNVSSQVQSGIYGPVSQQPQGSIQTGVTAGQYYITTLGQYHTTGSMIIRNISFSGVCRTAGGEGSIVVFVYDYTLGLTMYNGIIGGLVTNGTPFNMVIPGPIDVGNIANLDGASNNDIIWLMIRVTDIVGTNTYDSSLWTIETYQ